MNFDSDIYTPDEDATVTTPIRLTQAEMDTWKRTIQGFEFYQIPVIACTTCGMQVVVAKTTAPDKDIYYYLKFHCDHYQNPKYALPANATA